MPVTIEELVSAIEAIYSFLLCCCCSFFDCFCFSGAVCFKYSVFVT